MNLQIKKADTIEAPFKNFVYIFIDPDTSTLKGKTADGEIIEFTKEIDWASKGITVETSDVKAGKYFLNQSGSLVEGTLTPAKIIRSSNMPNTISITSGYIDTTREFTFGTLNIGGHYEVINNETLTIPKDTYLAEELTIKAKVNEGSFYVEDNLVSIYGGYLETQNIFVGNLYTNTSITPSTSNVTIPASSFLKNEVTIQGDANLLSENIIEGKTIFGVTGSATTSTTESEPTIATPQFYHCISVAEDGSTWTGREVVFKKKYEIEKSYKIDGLLAIVEEARTIDPNTYYSIPLLDNYMTGVGEFNGKEIVIKFKSYIPNSLVPCPLYGGGQVMSSEYYLVTPTTDSGDTSHTLLNFWYTDYGWYISTYDGYFLLVNKTAGKNATIEEIIEGPWYLIIDVNGETQEEHLLSSKLSITKSNILKFNDTYSAPDFNFTYLEYVSQEEIVFDRTNIDDYYQLTEIVEGSIYDKQFTIKIDASESACGSIYDPFNAGY